MVTDKSPRRPTVESESLGTCKPASIIINCSNSTAGRKKVLLVPQKFYRYCALFWPEIMLQLILLLLTLSLSVLAAEGVVPGTGGLRGHETHLEEEERKLTRDIGHPDDRNLYQLPSHRKSQTAVQVNFLNFYNIDYFPYPFH